MVKIEKMGKLQTSCSTTCTDGMVVSTRDKDVVDARAGVLEFLLVNHPLDCPVCDKGGECPLQDFSYSFGPAESRMDFPRRTFDGEGVKADVDFGPTLMLNRNRCILCTRCVRFMREVDGDAQIGVIDRGAGSEIATFREEGVHSLLSGNLMDVCPVGAITTRDYRFKSRPWDNPTVADTICTLCSKGCSTSAWIKAKPEWAKGTQLIRMTPRFNADVNSYWMCDIGRFDFRWVEGDTRLRKPMLRQGGSLQPVGWHDAEPRLREALQSAGAADPMSVRFLASAHASTEELFVLKSLVEGLQGPEGRGRRRGQLEAGAETAARRREVPVPATDAPNVNGARDLGFAVGAGNTGLPDVANLRRAVEAGKVRVLYVIDPGPADSIGDIVVDRRRPPERHARDAGRAGRRQHRADGRGRHRAAGRRLGREGRALHQRPGDGAGVVARHCASRRSARRLAHPDGAWRVARAVARLQVLGRCAPGAGRGVAGRAPTRGPNTRRSPGPSRRRRGCRRRIRPSGGSGTSCTRTCRPSKGTRSRRKGWRLTGAAPSS